MNKQKALEDVVKVVDDAIASLENINPQLFESKEFLSVVLNGLAHSLIKYAHVGGLSCQKLTKYINLLWEETLNFH